MKQSTDVTIIIPKAATTQIEKDLVQLNKFLVTKGFVEDSGPHGLLGDEYGYGENFENDIFMMHRFCWCEEKDCPWCYGCFCEMERINGKFQVVYVCDNCRNPKEKMPNFLYKPINLKIHWYKWIGRSMEFSERPNRSMWKQIMEECYRSLENRG